MHFESRSPHAPSDLSVEKMERKKALPSLLETMHCGAC